MTAQRWCAAGDCITVTDSIHPGVVYIRTETDGQPGRVSLTVTRAEWDALTAGIAAAERERIAVHIRDLESAARRFAGDPVTGIGFQAQAEILASVLVLIGEAQ